MSLPVDVELSRLAFNERLIEFCEDPNVPLLERVRLLGIAAARIDTFFMTRVGRLKRFAAIERMGGKGTSHGTPVAEQLDAVARRGHDLIARAYALLHGELLPALEGIGIRIERWADLDAADRTYALAALTKVPAMKVVAIDGTAAGRPFPHVRNLRPALLAARSAENPSEGMAVMELPENLPRFVPLADGRRLVPVEDVICGTIAEGSHGPFQCAHVFRVTRSAIMELDPDADDVLRIVEEEVTRRPFQEVVRVELEDDVPPRLRARLLEELSRDATMQGTTLDQHDVYAVPRPIDLAALEEIADLDLPELKCPPLKRRSPNVGESLIDSVLKEDLLVRFPFDAYEPTLQRVMEEASQRDDVESIKITMYRPGKRSKIVDALRAARANGVDVTVIIELKASFDERHNIELARTLEADGIRVALTPATMKVHSKIALITMRSGNDMRRVAMIGTGNINASTSGSYIDLWLLTGDQDRAREIDMVFAVLTGRGADPDSFKQLMVAPFNMRQRFVELIEREASNARAGRPSGIRATINGLTDRPVIDALSRASQAGVPVDLMVRDVCALRPGMPGVTDNVRVTSVVGHLLHHARIFHFVNGGADEYYIGSADWRPRNFDHRIEVVTRMSSTHHATLDAALKEALAAPRAWMMRGDGSYVRL